MNDLNYYPLDVESNIYGMTTLQFEDGTSKVLVATSDCQIYCINYSKFKPNTRGVEFTYIPNGAKIISIAALKRGPNDFVIGITHSLAPSLQKASARSSTSFHPASGVGDYGRLTTYYFNIYASGSILTNFDLDYVAQGCQTIRLKFVPYHLYQTEAITLVDPTNLTIKRRPFWLLTGAAIHAYYEDRPYQSFNEIPIEECFPELSNIPALALWIDVMNIEISSDRNHPNYERAIALGFEDGSVRLYHSVMSARSGKFELIRESSFDSYTTIVPSVRLFKISSISSSKLRQSMKSKSLLNETPDELTEQINLLVVSSTNTSLIFYDVLKQGLDKKCDLPESRRLDCSVTSAIGDTNLDGYNEILIGTHGRELITYRYDPGTKRYFLAQLSELNHPVFAISIVDLTGDALKEVAILLTNGVLVMQAAVKDVIEVCKRRVDLLLSLLKT